MTAATLTRARVAPMSEEAAAWVREHVWHNHHRKTYATNPLLYSRCACQYGECGHCHNDDHRECRAGESRESTAAWITTRTGQVPYLPGAGLPAVFEVGHVHRWVCSCHQDMHGLGWQQPDLDIGVTLPVKRPSAPRVATPAWDQPGLFD